MASYAKDKLNTLLPVRPALHSLVDLLQLRSQQQQDRLAYTFLVDGESQEAKITYEGLDARARAIAAWLQSLQASGERVLLIHPPSLEYIASFFGCLYAGAVAVPAYPPKLNHNLERLQAIVADAQATIALTSSHLLSRIEPLLDEVPAMKQLRWIETDKIPDAMAVDWREFNATGETMAFLQYTSGSTGVPKGVMLNHGNLLHNSALLSQAFEYTPDSYCVSWLPVYHDMGLIGAILQPLYGGFPCALMSPMSFLQRPLRWLKAISRYKATISGGPNFAYDLCVRKISPEQRNGLDLSRWSVAFNGSEPIRFETIERFRKAFEPCGFTVQAFFPCYGLAEATLMVSGGPKAKAPAVSMLDPRALEKNQVVEASDASARPKVSSGGLLPGHHVVVVNPETFKECSPGDVGEVWVSGPSVAQGYWNRAEESEQTFGAKLSSSGEISYLRTGDLGFIKDEELFITGRLKDSIIIRGLNHYPQDIEATVQRCSPALRQGCSAAFSVDVDGEERLIIVQEISHAKLSDGDSCVDSICQALAEEHELRAYAIVLVRPGTIPKTSSGKLQRGLCRAAFLNESLDVVAEWKSSFSSSAEPFIISEAKPETPKEVEDWLVSQLASRLGLQPDSIDRSEHLVRYGLDSIIAIELTYNLEETLGVSLPLTTFLQSASISELAVEALSIKTRDGLTSRPVSAGDRIASTRSPLSAGQRALWFVQQLTPNSPIYNIAVALRIPMNPDVAALRRSFQLLVDRHPSLRTTFHSSHGQPVQQVHEQMEVSFKQINASLWADDFLNSYLAEEAHSPFDFENGPLLRLQLLTRSEQEHVLLLVVHHLVTDFWSLAVLMQELGQIYSAEVNATHARLNPVRLHYEDYVRWQAQMLAGEEGERLFQYWQKRLAGELPVLDLPTDKPRPDVQTYDGSSHAFKIDEDVASRLRALSREQKTTLFVTLLSAFQVLLYRYTGQQDILVGSLTAGRNWSGFERTIGYFVNPIILRGNLSGEPTFRAFLDRMRRDVLDAFEHQDYPFQLLVERLQPVRDARRPPLFQVMFVWQKTHQLGQSQYAPFALGETGGRAELGGLVLESISLEQRVAQFDLTLVMAEGDGELMASLQYNSNLFDEATMARMAGHFQTILQAVAANPDRSVSELPMLTPAEQLEIVEWNNTRAEYQQHKCAHELFEAQVERSPDAIAIAFKDKELSYCQLNLLSDKLAHKLRMKGVGSGVIVGLYAERSLEMMVGLLAILKAGGAYLPLDPSYPRERIAFILEDAQAQVILAQRTLGKNISDDGAEIIYLDEACEEPLCEWPEIQSSGAAPDDLAYVIYTSGSTGRPKGVMITHRSVVNFFSGMDERAGCGPDDTLLAVTTVSFDISVLELLWPLTRGARVAILDEAATKGASVLPKPRGINKTIDFSLFYFASDDSAQADDRYKLLLEGAKFADENGFTSVWTPERHFHAFGGLYPNPSVVSAALAVLTERVQIRAGSVVLPLHNPIRVAEEWSLVDNLSKGRVAVAFASGWHANDFVFFPEKYDNRKSEMMDGIQSVQRLWRGESIQAVGGAGNRIEVKIFPKPIQPKLPVWLTAAGSPETFVKAGEIGANVLTHLLGQSLEDVEEKIKLYRESLARHGHDPQAGCVTMMLHTFLADDLDAVRSKVRVPFTNYLRSSVGLIANLIKSLNLPLDLESMSPEDMDDMLRFAFDRYFGTSALFGTPETCCDMVERVKAIGVDEIACLIDFGIDIESTLEGLRHLNRLREKSNALSVEDDYSLAAQAASHKATMLQCTPSMMRMFLTTGEMEETLKGLRVLMLGGEELPVALAKDVKEKFGAKVINMYGPTETTIWSSTHEVCAEASSVSIGRPIANTQMYVLDAKAQPVPPGVPGELCIGGKGLARGYINRPDLTAERFIPDRFGTEPGGRLYRTGDVAKYMPDGSIEYLGRLDHQVKIRGHRVELGEIEAAIGELEAVREAVAVVREDTPGDQRLIAYVVAAENAPIDASELRDLLRKKLPEYMIPSAIVPLHALPLTANGKVNRKALPAATGMVAHGKANHVEPRNSLEQAIASVWQQALKVEKVGINDNFFDLGGHSLLMAQVHSKLREMLDKDFPLIKLLQYPTIGSFAKYLNRQDEGVSFEQSLSRARKQKQGLMRQRQAIRPRHNPR